MIKSGNSSYFEPDSSQIKSFYTLSLFCLAFWLIAINSNKK